jgi:hypothetical protein
LLKKEDDDAVNQCVKALNASANEVYVAWLYGTVPSDDANFAAWAYAPMLSSVSSPGLDNAAPMFNQKGQLRKSLHLNGHQREDQVQYGK